MSSFNVTHYQPGAAPGAALAAGDPRLQRLAALAAEGEYHAAAAAASELLEEGARDIRVLCHALLGVFLERGAPGLPDLFEGVSSWLGAGWAELGPSRRKEAISETALGWLFRTVLEQASFHEQRRDEAWQAWFQACDAALLGRTQEALAGARAAMSAALGEAACAEPLGRLEAWIRRSLAPAARAAAEAAAAKAAMERRAAEEAAAAHEEREEGDEELEAEDEEPEDEDEPEPPEPAVSRGRPGHSAAITIEVSPALAQLLRRIEAFQALVDRDEIARAAVVAHDLQRAIDAFDPRRYLPGILAAYCGLLSARIEDIAPCWEEAGSPAWRALEQLYEVDLEAFVEGGR